ncbi:MAG: porphobilinogen synthase [Deltaproteobacteria bacterium]|nr:porphobilinogen synthase [Deltaproteobacteria bacterium]MBN2672369.1 porphobilinogen synthase [Deltaproteobacteria bacterium]
MTFPIIRLRRNRRTEQIRSLVRETTLQLEKLVYPLFVIGGTQVKNPIASMPGCYQLSIDLLLEEVKELQSLNISSVILFGIPDSKDEVGSSGYAEDGIVPTAISALKKEFPNLCIWADVCLCEYTSHGHCGVVEHQTVNNDKTLPLLAEAARVYTAAGADIIAPSDMMDGRVDAIRAALDAAGYEDTPICAYSAKYASAYYGPFRDAAGSAPGFGDRRSYQMDPANSDEALREVALDLDEGADMVMVKPALAYLDIIRRVKDEFMVPVVAYNVSGEYSMIKAAGQLGWIDEERVMMETLLSIRRAGADIIITYFAKDVAKLLNNRK